MSHKQQASLLNAVVARKEREHELQAALHGVKLKTSGRLRKTPLINANLDTQLRAGMAKGLPIKFGKRKK